MPSKEENPTMHTVFFPGKMFSLNFCNWKLEFVKHQDPERLTPQGFPSPDLVYMCLSAKVLMEQEKTSAWISQ